MAGLSDKHNLDVSNGPLQVKIISIMSKIIVKIIVMDSYELLQLFYKLMQNCRGNIITRLVCCTQVGLEEK